MTDFVFDASAAPEPVNFDPMPAADYLMQITASEMDVKSTGTEQLKFTFKVLDGPHKDREINMWYTVKCTTEKGPKAVEIGQRQLREICEAHAKTGFTRTEELHNVPVMCKVGVNPPNASGAVYNCIKRVMARTTAAPANSQPAATEAAPWAQG